MFAKLFSWEDTDYTDGHLMFFECTLKVDIGNVTAGSTIDCINVDYINGVLSLERQDKMNSTQAQVLGRWDLNAVVGASRYATAGGISEERS